MKKRKKKTTETKENNFIKARYVIGLLLVILLSIVVFSFDDKIIKFIEGLRVSYLDYFFLSLVFASNAVIIFFFLTSLFLWKSHKRRWVFPLWITSFLVLGVSFILKILVKRTRPFENGVVSVLAVAFNFMKDNFNTWNFGFPSFQAMLVFSTLPILNKEFKKFKYVWLIFACLVAFSRAYFGLHYLSDVLAGAIIGFLIGQTMVIIEDKYEIGLRIMKGLKIKK